MTDRTLIAGGRIVDGSGRPSYDGALLVEDGRIVAVVPDGSPLPDEGPQQIDARGKALCPGFVDVHTHSDLVPLVEPWMNSALRQGVTTVIVGNCGSSASPEEGAPELATLVGVPPLDLDLSWDSFGAYLERVESCRPAVHVGALVGHGAVRRAVLGSRRRPPWPDEMDQMRGIVREAMADGAFGLSTGLVYAPGMYAATDEITTLARETAPFGGLYASHIRGEGAMLFEAIDEAFAIARHAGVPAHVSHLKLEGSRVWGRGAELLDRLDDARRQGQDVTGDQYPYAAWSSELWSLLPPWASRDDLAEILRDASVRDRLAQVVAEGEDGWQSSIDGVGWDHIVVETHVDPSLRGRSIADVARERDDDPSSVAFAMLLADPDTGVIGHAMREEDVREICARPDVLVASDASAMSPEGPLGDAPVHPRTYGTFPRVLGPFVREGVLTFEAAVRKMTSLPADRFGLTGRGRLVPGAVADLVLVNPATVRDGATYGAPHVYPDGIDLVVVAGSIAWDADRGLGTRSGRVLRRG